MGGVIEGAEGLDVARDGDIVTVTMNRPEVMNAMTGAMFSEFGRIFREWAKTYRIIFLQGLITKESLRALLFDRCVSII